MEFIETPHFTNLITQYVPDEHYRALQLELQANPEKGDLISGSGGLRKIRVGLPGSGKRGSARVIYLYLKIENLIYLLLIYRKSKSEKLTRSQLSELRALADQIKQAYRHESRK